MLEEALKNLPPYTITFDDITYTQIAETEYYLAPNDEHKYTPHQILTRHFPKFYKSDTQRVIMPPFTAELSISNRRRHYFAALAKQKPVTEYPPNIDDLVSFYSHYDTYPTPNDFLYQEYKACYMETKENANDAATLLLRNGPVNTLSCMKYTTATKAYFFKEEYLEDGIHIEIQPKPEINHVVRSALSTARAEYAQVYYLKPTITRQEISFINGRAYSKVFGYNYGHISLPKDTCMSVLTTMRHYLDSLINVFYKDTELPPPPTVNIEEPVWETTFNYKKSFIIKYEDFQFYTDSTPLQLQQRLDNSKNSCLDSLCTKVEAAGLQPNTIYTRQDLKDAGIFDSAIQAAKKYGLIDNSKRNQYILTFLSEPEEEEAIELVF